MRLTTEDLILRTAEPEDGEEVARLWDMEQGPIPRQEAEKVLERMEENHQKKPPGADLPPVPGGDGAGGPQDLHWLVRPGRNLWRPAAPVLLHCTGAPGTGLCQDRKSVV